MNIPTAVKAVGQYVKRAEEIEKDSTNPDGSIIAFWCRQWAIERSIPYFSDPTVADFVSQLMDIQEQNKAAAGDKTMGKNVCENHAHLVFERADADDRAGKGNKMTAKLFYNAASFLDILEQFDELKEDPDVLNMRKYAKWKANDILQAINEGRTPQIGGPDGGRGAPAASNVSAPVLPAVPSPRPSLAAVPPAPAQQQRTPTAPPAFVSQVASAPSTSAAVGSAIGTVINSISNVFVSKPINAVPTHRSPPQNNSDARVKDAIELSQFAVASMKYGDIAGARAKLAEALRRLE